MLTRRSFVAGALASPVALALPLPASRIIPGLGALIGRSVGLAAAACLLRQDGQEDRALECEAESAALFTQARELSTQHGITLPAA